MIAAAGGGGGAGAFAAGAVEVVEAVAIGHPVEGEGVGGVAGDRDEAGLDVADVIDQLPVLVDDVGDGFPRDHRRHIVPPVRRVLVEQCERVLEPLVLLRRPLRHRAPFEHPVRGGAQVRRRRRRDDADFSVHIPPFIKT